MYITVESVLFVQYLSYEHITTAPNSFWYILEPLGAKILIYRLAFKKIKIFDFFPPLAGDQKMTFASTWEQQPHFMVKNMVLK